MNRGRLGGPGAAGDRRRILTVLVRQDQPIDSIRIDLALGTPAG